MRLKNKACLLTKEKIIKDNGANDIWKGRMMEKLELLSKDNSSEKVWKTRMIDKLESLVIEIEVKLLKYILRITCIFFLVLNQIFDTH
jgi:hypothetical protein